jgi:hypothetical protein
MTKTSAWIRTFGLVAGLLPAAAAAAELKVVQAGPRDEVAKLEQAKEVRIVVSAEVFGRTPSTVVEIRP